MSPAACDIVLSWTAILRLRIETGIPTDEVARAWKWRTSTVRAVIDSHPSHFSE